MPNPIKELEHEGLIATPVPIRLSPDGKVSADIIVSINRTLASIVTHINKGLSVGTSDSNSRVGNFRNQWLVFTAPGTANTQFELPHGLGRTPIGFTTWYVDAAAIVYVSNYGSWNRDRILLKCSLASTNCAIELA